MTEAQRVKDQEALTQGLKDLAHLAAKMNADGAFMAPEVFLPRLESMERRAARLVQLFNSLYPTVTTFPATAHHRRNVP